MHVVSTPNAPAPGGHYAQAVVHRGVIYVSGQLPIDPHTGVHCSGPIEEQTELVLKNLAAILDAAGSSLDRVLKTTVYVSDISLWSRVNVVYARVFGNHHPARAVVPTGELHHGCLIEIEALAEAGEP